jgi:hypothetical protein
MDIEVTEEFFNAFQKSTHQSSKQGLYKSKFSFFPHQDLSNQIHILH